MKKILLSLSVFTLAFGVNAQMVARTVLLEHFTQASCAPCAIYNPAIEAIIQDPLNLDKIVAIKYQTDWPGFDPMNLHNPIEVDDRRALYTVTGVPNSVLDGNFYNGHPASWSQSALDTRAGILSPFSLDVKALYNLDSTAVTVQVDVEAGVTVNGNFVLQIAVVEDHISFTAPPGTNGESDFYDVMKKFLPTSAGTAISSSWTAGSTATINESWTTSNVYDKSTLAVVVWIQNTSTGEVIQAKKESFIAEGPPVASFIADHIYISPGTTVNFTDRTALFPTGWNWNFDVGNIGGVTPTTSTTQNPSATFNNYGDYDVKLVADNAFGIDSIVQSSFIHVIDCQDIDIDIQMDNYASTVSWEILNDTSGQVLAQGSGYPNVNGGQLISESLCLGNGCYTFKMYDLGGNGICCVSGNGSYTITNNSQTTVLGTGGQFGFADSLQFCVSDAVIAPVASFTSSQTTICEHNLVEFTDLSTNTATAWLWTFPGGNPSTSTLKNPIIDYPSSGTYDVIFQSFNNVGASNTVTSTSYITVNPGPTVNAGLDVNICSNNVNPVNLSGSVTLATGVAWSTLISANLSNSTSLNAIYTPNTIDFNRGYTDITLTSTIGNGSCVPATDVIRITYTNAPVVNAGDGLTFCETDSLILLTGLVTGSTGGIWSGGYGTFVNDSSLSTSYLIDPADRIDGSVTIKLTSTGNGVCNAESDSVYFILQDSVFVDAGPDQALCPGSNVVLSGDFNGSNNVRWYSSGTGIFGPSANLKNPIYTPSAADLTGENLVLTLHSTGNGVCPGAIDTLILRIECAGIENLLSSRLNVYPNPANNVISIDSKDLDIVDIKLINTLGENVKIFNINNKSDIVSLSVSDVANGTYILNINTNEGVVYKSISIQK